MKNYLEDRSEASILKKHKARKVFKRCIKCVGQGKREGGGEREREKLLKMFASRWNFFWPRSCTAAPCYI